ncbi:uncharacterized protein LOC125372451 [Haliotis rufescens]|uniref:uncharacterized protein LOC125372451 n=1 Tax=Haliotis rufescens TaxID=6454 RepID=UPI00201F4E33|nr:uncharacterized protein LOC125372451 [Haliotis rufescens]
MNIGRVESKYKEHRQTAVVCDSKSECCLIFGYIFSVAPFSESLLSSNGGFKHESNEVYSPAHRDIEIAMHQGHMTVQPYGHEKSGIEVTGGLESITAAWDTLDEANWEVRSGGYRNFTVGDKEPFLMVEQNVTCAAGRVPGGLFCCKCSQTGRIKHREVHKPDTCLLP